MIRTQRAPSTSRSLGSAPVSNVAGICSAVYQDVQDGKVPLPSLPDLAIRVRKLVRQQDFVFSDLAKIIETDPGLASFILKIANSPAFRGKFPTDKLAPAINRLGANSVTNIVTTYSLRTMFRSKSPALQQALRKVWNQSVHLGATSAVLADHLTRLDPDRALLGGLLANIGALPLLAAAGRRSDIAFDTNLVETMLQTYARQVGVVMLQAWQLDEELIDVVRNREVWHRQGDESADLTDVVLVASMIVNLETQPQFKILDETSMPALQRLRPPPPDTHWSAELISEFLPEIEETRAELVG